MTCINQLKLNSLLIAFCLISITAFSQAPTEIKLASESNLIMIGKNKGNQNLLRWAPKNYALWQQLNTSGYILERYELNDHRVDWSTKTTLTRTALKPKSIEEWKASFAPENNLAAIAVQSIYGETKTLEDPEAGQFSGIVSQHMQQANLHGFGMLVADASMDIAQSMALAYIDSDISPDLSYAYKLYGAEGFHDVPVDTAWIILKRGKGAAIPQEDGKAATFRLLLLLPVD